MIDPAWAKVLSDWALFLVGAIATGLAWAWLLLAKRGDGHSAQVATIAGRIDDHAQRLSTLEATMANAPKHDDLTNLADKLDVGLIRTHERMDRLSESLARVEGGMGVVQGTVARLETYLMEHGPRAGDRQ